MSGIDGTSRHNNRPAGVAEIFQVSQHVVEFHADDSRHVLAKHPIGSCLRNNSAHLRPEVTVILRASALPGATERLARKSPCDDVGADAFDVSDVAIVGHVGPVAFEDFRGIRFDLTKADCLQSVPLGRQRKAADSREEV